MSGRTPGIARDCSERLRTNPNGFASENYDGTGISENLAGREWTGPNPRIAVDITGDETQKHRHRQWQGPVLTARNCFGHGEAPRSCHSGAMFLPPLVPAQARIQFLIKDNRVPDFVETSRQWSVAFDGAEAIT